MADIWRERGGVVAALEALRSGIPDEALDAAKALGDLVQDRGAAEALVEGGVVRPLLQVFDSKNLKAADTSALEKSLQALVEAHAGIAAQLVAAYSDPDMRVAFSAIYSCGNLLQRAATRERLLKAGVAGALVAALSHESLDCCSAAAFVTLLTEDKALLAALRMAGLVPALMTLMRGGSASSSKGGKAKGRAPSASSPSRRSFGLLGGRRANVGSMLGPSRESTDEPEVDAAFIACNSLRFLIKVHPQVTREIAATPRPVGAIMSCLRQYKGEAAVGFADLLHTMLLHHKDGPYKVPLRKELLDEGFPSLVPSLVSPDELDLAVHSISSLFAMFESLGYASLNLATAEAIMASFEQFLDSDVASQGEAAELAVLLLNQMALQCYPPKLELSRRHLPSNAIRNAARLLNSGKQGTGALGALPLVMTQIKQDPRSFQAEAAGRAEKVHTPGRTDALALAVSGGFIPGVLDMMKWVGLATFTPEPGETGDASRASARGRARGIGAIGDTDEEETTARLRTLVWGAVAEILWPCREEYTMKALECGLLTEMKACIRSGEAVAQRFVLLILPRLCSVPQAVVKMRGEGIMPTMLLDLADTSHPEVLEIFQRTAGDLREQRRETEGGLTAMLELLSGGLLHRLKQARDRNLQRNPGLAEKLKATIRGCETLAKQHANILVEYVRQRVGVLKEDRANSGRKVQPSLLLA